MPILFPEASGQGFEVGDIALWIRFSLGPKRFLERRGGTAFLEVKRLAQRLGFEEADDIHPGIRGR
jgi:hypothetical protein